MRARETSGMASRWARAWQGVRDFVLDALRRYTWRDLVTCELGGILVFGWLASWDLARWAAAIIQMQLGVGLLCVGHAVMRWWDRRQERGRG
jgi:hypothetical protein